MEVGQSQRLEAEKPGVEKQRVGVEIRLRLGLLRRRALPSHRATCRWTSQAPAMKSGDSSPCTG